MFINSQEVSLIGKVMKKFASKLATLDAVAHEGRHQNARGQYVRNYFFEKKSTRYSSVLSRYWQ